MHEKGRERRTLHVHSLLSLRSMNFFSSGGCTLGMAAGSRRTKQRSDPGRSTRSQQSVHIAHTFRSHGADVARMVLEQALCLACGQCTCALAPLLFPSLSRAQCNSPDSPPSHIPQAAAALPPQALSFHLKRSRHCGIGCHAAPLAQLGRSDGHWAQGPGWRGAQRDKRAVACPARFSLLRTSDDRQHAIPPTPTADLQDKQLGSSSTGQYMGLSQVISLDAARKSALQNMFNGHCPRPCLNGAGCRAGNQQCHPSCESYAAHVVWFSLERNFPHARRHTTPSAQRNCMNLHKRSSPWHALCCSSPAQIRSHGTAAC